MSVSCAKGYRSQGGIMRYSVGFVLIKLVSHSLDSVYLFACSICFFSDVDLLCMIDCKEKRVYLNWCKINETVFEKST